MVFANAKPEKPKERWPSCNYYWQEEFVVNESEQSSMVGVDRL
jgi:hypothetical protein